MIERPKSAPLRAGERLVAPRPDEAPRRAKPPKPPRRGGSGWVGRLAARLVGGVFALGVVLLIAGAGAGYVAYHHFSADLPDVDGLRNYQPPVMTRVFASDGSLVADFATERRIFVPFSAIPDVVKQAFISAEDQNFWTHPGIDPLAILRAAVFDLTHMGEGRRPIGASTITQQVAKNMLLDNQVSLARKAKEAILAMRIDHALTKQRVLELYLNEIYLGVQSYGVAAAAQAYFNKPLDQLSIAEAAFLAALPKAPNNYNPFRYPDAARSRRDWVLDRMADDHAITATQEAAAKAQPVIPAEYRRPDPIPGADWYTEEVRRELVARFGADSTTQGGLMVRTSLVPTLQAAAERSVRDGLMAYDRRRGGWRGPVAHLDLVGAALASGWAPALGNVARPTGMLPDWRLGVVLEATDSEAKLGWLDASAQGSSGQAVAGQPHPGTLLLSDLGWARPVHDGKLGPAPRRMSDVVKPGDVVMLEPAAALAAKPGSKSGRDVPPPKPVATIAGHASVAQRMELRQIPVAQAALVSIDPATGRVVALVGGWSFDGSQFNRATQAKRQPGSSFKPIVYLTALEHGVSPSQRFLDAPVVVDQGALGRWRPNNYEMDFNGPTPLRVALEKSLNLVTLRVAAYVGMDAVADTAIAFHMVDSMPLVLPAAIGAVDTTPMREAAAYASIDAGGREVVPSLIDSVQDRDGHDLWRPTDIACPGCGDLATPPQPVDERKQIADPASDYQLINMMEGVVQRGTGVSAVTGLNHPIAGKTGTSQDFNDAWFSGFTADLVTVVWVGFDTPATLGNNETGAAAAAPIWHQYMAVALKDRPALQFAQPPGVTMGQWDSGSGMVTDAFKPGQVPGGSGPVVVGIDLAHSVAAAAMSDAPVVATSDTTAAAASRPVSGGVDSAMGGLY
jgi:penicillin-binding protein 1A